MEIEGERLTSEFESPQLESDQPVANLYKVHQRIEVVGGKNETVPCTVVPPPSQEQIATEAVLQGSG